MNDLKDLIKQFMPFAQEQMGFNRPPKLFLRQDATNGADPLGKTGFYDPQAESITIYVSNRHPKDILRSLAHELMHHTQKCNGDFENAEGMGEQGYAQNNPHMRNMEIQAYQASIVFRDWEDSLKETIYYEHLQKGANKTMSFKEWKNGELTTLLSEAWGFKFDPQLLNEQTTTEAKEEVPWGTPGTPGFPEPKKRKRQDTLALPAVDKKCEGGAPVDRRGNCPEESRAAGGRVSPYGLEEAGPPEEDPEEAAARKEMGEEEEEQFDEVASSSGRKSPHRDRRGDDERKRPMEEADEDEEGLTEEQIRAVARRVITRIRESNKNG
jgi:hypothetical protein